DVDGDSRLDIAVSCRVGSVVLLYHGNGDGTFGASRRFPVGLPGFLAAGDLNGDGLIDVIASTYFRDTLGVLLGQAGGYLAEWSRSPQDRPIENALLADGDGRADLVVGSDGTCSILLGHGDGTFAPPSRITFAGFVGAPQLGDVNGDGILDLAVDHNAAGVDSITILVGLGDGTFEAVSAIDVGYYDKHLAGL